MSYLWNILPAVVLVLLLQTDGTYANGRLWEPPSRSSMWRRGYNTTKNVNDNAMNCGGFTNQWIAFGGLCGVCGDPYQQKPREHEHGGKYASGFITRTYPVGGTVGIVVDLTSNHKGFFEFKVCPLYDRVMKETTECMDRHPLKIKGGDAGGYKYTVNETTKEGKLKLQLILPPNFVCKQCVLQWHYNTGSRWGCDPDMTCGNGKGRQEQFYGCSDIAIANIPKMIAHSPSEAKYPSNINLGLHDLGSKYKWDFVPDKPHHGQIKSILNSRPRNRANIKIKGNQITENDLPKGTTKYMKLTAVEKKVKQYAAHQRIARFFENVIVDALLGSYGANNKTVDSKPTHCVAKKRYSRNPIISQWCIKACAPRAPCSMTMCSCKSEIGNKQVKFKNPFEFNQNNTRSQQTLRKLGLKRQDMIDFVRHQIIKQPHQKMRQDTASNKIKTGTPIVNNKNFPQKATQLPPVFSIDTVTSRLPVTITPVIMDTTKQSKSVPRLPFKSTTITTNAVTRLPMSSNSRKIPSNSRTRLPLQTSKVTRKMLMPIKSVTQLSVRTKPVALKVTTKARTQLPVKTSRVTRKFFKPTESVTQLPVRTKPVTTKLTSKSSPGLPVRTSKVTRKFFIPIETVTQLPVRTKTVTRNLPVKTSTVIKKRLLPTKAVTSLPTRKTEVTRRFSLPTNTDFRLPIRTSSAAMPPHKTGNFIRSRLSTKHSTIAFTNPPTRKTNTPVKPNAKSTVNTITNTGKSNPFINRKINLIKVSNTPVVTNLNMRTVQPKYTTTKGKRFQLIPNLRTSHIAQHTEQTAIRSAPVTVSHLKTEQRTMPKQTPLVTKQPTSHLKTERRTIPEETTLVTKQPTSHLKTERKIIQEETTLVTKQPTSHLKTELRTIPRQTPLVTKKPTSRLKTGRGIIPSLNRFRIPYSGIETTTSAVHVPEAEFNQTSLDQFVVGSLKKSTAGVPTSPTRYLDLTGFVKDDTSRNADKSVVGATHIICTASADFKDNKFMKGWCLSNCSFGYCPKSVCTCRKG